MRINSKKISYLCPKALIPSFFAFLSTLAIASIPLSKSSTGGPNESLTKWWQGELNKFRRCEGLMSKKIPGITIVCSLRSSSKNVCVREQSYVYDQSWIHWQEGSGSLNSPVHYLGVPAIFLNSTRYKTSHAVERLHPGEGLWVSLKHGLASSWSAFGARLVRSSRVSDREEG